MKNFQNEDYFDFTTVEEVPEDFSSEKRSCPHCGKPIPADSLFCLFCGERISPKSKAKWLILVPLLILIATFLFWIFSYD